MLSRWGAKSILEKEPGFQAFLDALATATAQAAALEPAHSTTVTSPGAAANGQNSRSKRAKLNVSGQGVSQAAATQQVMLSAAHTADLSMLLMTPPVRLACSGKLVRCGLERVRELHAQLSVAAGGRDDGSAEDISAAVSRRVAQRLLVAA